MLDRKSTLVVRAQEDKTRRSRSTGAPSAGDRSIRNWHCRRPADRSPAGSISGPIYWLVPGDERCAGGGPRSRALSSDGSAPPSDRPQQRIAAPQQQNQLTCYVMLIVSGQPRWLFSVVIQLARTNTMNGCMFGFSATSVTLRPALPAAVVGLHVASSRLLLPAMSSFCKPELPLCLRLNITNRIRSSVVGPLPAAAYS